MGRSRLPIKRVHEQRSSTTVGRIKFRLMERTNPNLSEDVSQPRFSQVDSMQSTRSALGGLQQAAMVRRASPISIRSARALVTRGRASLILQNCAEGAFLELGTFCPL